MARVIMLIHEENGRYGASFPDFPGCTTAAADLDTLFAKAPEALGFHVAGVVEGGERLPALRSLAQLRDDPAFREDARDAELVGFVPVELPGRAVRINISLEERLLSLIDQVAGAAGETRSGFLAKAAQKRLAEIRARSLRGSEAKRGRKRG
jgi:predicted RNase H-like HicB family nuclease